MILNNIYVYHNTELEQLQINSEENFPIDLVSIYNVSGQSIYSSKILNQESVHIDIQDFSPGIYYVTLQAGNERISRKFIKD